MTNSKYAHLYAQADLNDLVLLDMPTVGKMTFQVSGLWIEEWSKAGYGPDAYCYGGRFFTCLRDVLDWWHSSNFAIFLKYAEERTAATAKWSNSKWFKANRHLLVRKRCFD